MFTDNNAIPLSIISDSRLMRDGLIALLATYASVRLEGAYPSDEDLESVGADPPGHVVLLDGGVGQEALLRWTRFWTRVRPAAHVIALEVSDDVDQIVTCIEAGAGGYALRGASPAEVADVILSVLMGAPKCSPQVAARLFDRLADLSAAQSNPAVELSPLTARELEVLRLIAADCSNEEIADRLVIQLSTVKHHVHRILEKLSQRHRWDAARIATERGWLRSATPDRQAT